jgi:NADH-quinone oxidoreductase subunit L
MMAALGVGAFVAASFHLVTHAFFKALLFLGSGSVIHGMEHGVLHTGKHVDPQDMFNMGGLRKKMPITFWTFLIGGLALSGFPLVTAGFWSKDEILAEAWGTGNWLSFAILALAALMTAFYTMRQISLTFLGEPRTEAAQHAKETPWTMTLPLVVLCVFAVTIGWVGIPEGFFLIGGWVPNYYHEFVGGTLIEHPEMLPVNIVPLATSLIVSLGGLYLGWVLYRRLTAGEKDPLEAPLGATYRVVKNKYYFDELYDRIFVRPSYWFAETFTYKIVDLKIIDGFLHWVARVSGVLGNFFRNYIDKPIVNGFGDFVGEGTKWLGRTFRFIQSGKVQQYMIVALVSLAAFSVLFYYLLTSTR